MILINTLTFSILFYTCLAGEQDVAEYTDSDFSSKIVEHETVLIMFYAPWCGHCKKLKPEYAKAAEELTTNDPPVILAKIDCTENGKETCKKFEVSGYPTLKIFQNGEFSREYSGPRDAAGIVKYMKSQVGPSSTELSSMEELEKYLEAKNDVSIVGFFEKETDLKTAFMKIADKLQEKVRFAHTSFKNILDKYEATDDIILFRPVQMRNKFEEDYAKYIGAASSSDINEFITKNYHGLAGHRKTDNSEDFSNPLIVAYYAVDYKKNTKRTNYWRNRILKVAKQFEGQLTFAISSKDDYQDELDEYGIDSAKSDTPVVLARDDKNQKFKMEDEFSVENLEKFVKNFLDGKLQPYLKSEAIPKYNDDPVKVAVAKNFEEIVTNNNKDTLIEFYAPWCGHCKKLAPTFDELGEKLKDEDVLIVKMDAIANDVPQPYVVEGFPTLFWAAKDSKDKPVKYEGGRQLKQFIKYIAKHATNELKSYDRDGNLKDSVKTEL